MCNMKRFENVFFFIPSNNNNDVSNFERAVTCENTVRKKFF